MSDKLPTPEIKKERDQSTGKTAQQKTEIKSNASLMKRAREVNQYDIRLFKKGKIILRSSSSSLSSSSSSSSFYLIMCM